MAVSATIGRLLVELFLNADPFKSGLADAEKELKKRAQLMESAASAFGSAATAGFAAAGLAITAFGAATVKVGADFEQAMATLGAVANAAPGSAGFEALQDQARLLGTTTLFGATQAAEGLTELTKAGLSVASAIEASDDVIALAGAHQLDLARASSIVAATLTQFQLSATEAGRVTDVLSTAANASLASVDSLAEALKFAAPIAAGFGNDLETTTAVLASFTNLGIDAGLAGRALRSGMAAVTQQSKDEMAALKAAGLTYAQVNPEVNSLVEILHNLADSSLTTTQAMAIFGTESGGAFSALATGIKTGAVDIDGMLTGLQDSAGSTAAIYETMMGTLKSQSKLGINAVQDLMITLFELFGPSLAGIVAETTDLVNKTAEIVKARSAEFKAQFEAIGAAVSDFIKDEGPAAVEQLLDIGSAFLTATHGLVVFFDEAKNLLDLFNMLNPSFLLLQAGIDSLSTTQEKQVGVGNAAAASVEELNTHLGEQQSKLYALNAEIGNYAKLHGEEAAASDSYVQGLQNEVSALEMSTTAIEAELNARFDSIAAETEARQSKDAMIAKLKAEAQAIKDAAAGGGTPASDSALKAAAAALKAFEKDATSAAEALAKAMMEPTDLLNFEAEQARTAATVAFEETVAKARAAKQSTAGIEQLYADQIVAIDTKLALDQMALEAEVNQKAIDDAVARTKWEEAQAEQEFQQALDQSNATLGARQAALDAWLASSKKNAGSRLGIDEQYQIDQASLLNEQSAAQDAVMQDATLSAEEKAARLETIDATYHSKALQLEAEHQTALTEAFAERVQKIKDGIASVLGAIKSAASSAQAAIEGALGKLGDMVEMLSGASLSLQGLVDFAGAGSTTDETTGVTTTAAQTATATADAAILFATNLAANIGPVVEAVVAKIPEVMEAVAGAVEPVISALADHMDEIIQALADGMVDVAKALADHAPELVQAIVDNLPILIEGIARAASTLIVALVKALPGLIDSLVAQIPAIVDALVEALVPAIVVLLKKSGPIIVALIEAVPVLVGAIVDHVDEIVAAVIKGLFGANGLVYHIDEIALALVKATVELSWMIAAELPYQIVKGIVVALMALDWGKVLENLWNGFLDIAEKVGEIILEAITFGLANTSLDKQNGGALNNDKVGFWDALAETATVGAAKTDAGGGWFASGAKNIAKEMMVKVHPGEAILPANENPNNPGAQSSGGYSDAGGMVSLQVAIDGQVVDGLLMTSKRKGQMPALSRMLRKTKGVRSGLDTRGFQSRVS